MPMSNTRGITDISVVYIYFSNSQLMSVINNNNIYERFHVSWYTY